MAIKKLLEIWIGLLIMYLRIYHHRYVDIPGMLCYRIHNEVLLVFPIGPVIFTNEDSA